MKGIFSIYTPAWFLTPKFTLINFTTIKYAQTFSEHSFVTTMVDFYHLGVSTMVSSQTKHFSRIIDFSCAVSVHWLVTSSPPVATSSSPYTIHHISRYEREFTCSLTHYLHRYHHILSLPFFLSLYSYFRLSNSLRLYLSLSMSLCLCLSTENCEKELDAGCPLTMQAPKPTHDLIQWLLTRHALIDARNQDPHFNRCSGGESRAMCSLLHTTIF